MRFRCENQEYESEELLVPPIKDPYIVAVFITKDYSHVFAAFVDSQIGLYILLVRGEELRDLADRTRVVELRMAAEAESNNPSS